MPTNLTDQPPERRTARPAVLATFLVAAVVATACVEVFRDVDPQAGTSDTATASADLGDADVTVIAEDLRFVDPPSELEAGTLTIGLDNRGRAPHDLTFDDGVGTVAVAEGGEQDVAEVTLEPGTYTVTCDVPGHRQAGMEFEVTVS
jgi:plastocyanin